MAKRILKSDELIRQLKHVITAQHAKIEEQRRELELERAAPKLSALGPAVQSHVVASIEQERDIAAQKCEELSLTVRRLEGEKDRMAKEIATLKKVNNRFKSMVRNPKVDESKAIGMTPPDQVKVAEGLGPDFKIPPLDDIALGTPRYRPRPTPQSLTGQAQATSESRSGIMATRLSRLMAGMTTFWQRTDSPRAVLGSLLESAQRLVGDGPPAQVAVYITDPWLRAAYTNPDETPVLFHLSGKTTVQAVRQEKEGPNARVEPPRFQDLSQLPLRTRTVLAIPVQTSSRRLAVIQAVAIETSSKERAASPRNNLGASAGLLNATPRNCLGASGGLSETGAPEDSPTSSLTDSQHFCLQLASQLAAGALEQQEKLGRAMRALERLRSCLDISVAINRSHNLHDLEQRVKHEFGIFFQAKLVRILFFDESKSELLLSPSQVQAMMPGSSSRQKSCQFFTLDRGVVGHCARRRQIVHVPNVGHHPFVDAVADGTKARTIHPEAGMLCGPLVADHRDGTRLVGVVQLLDRDDERGEADAGAFTREEEGLFQRLVAITAAAAWRVWQAQQLLSGDQHGKEITLEQMLTSNK